MKKMKIIENTVKFDRNGIKPKIHSKFAKNDERCVKTVLRYQHNR